MNELDEKGVSNNSFYRGISNILDKIPGFKDSSIRAYIHGLYHDHVANQKEKHGNYEVAATERKRAQEQYARVSECSS